AINVFEDTLRARPYEINSYRDLALAWESKALKTLEKADFQRAMDYYIQAVMAEFEMDAPIKVTALMELNRLYSIAKRQGWSLRMPDKRLIRPLDLDMRVVLAWNSRAVDLDLWVTEP